MFNPAIIGRNALLFVKILDFRRVLISRDCMPHENDDIIWLLVHREQIQTAFFVESHGIKCSKYLILQECLSTFYKAYFTEMNTK